jgi:hypothetical protein
MDDLLLKYTDGEIYILTPSGYRAPLPGEILPLKDGGYVSLDGDGGPKGMPLWLDAGAVVMVVATLLILGRGIFWADSAAATPAQKIEMRLPASNPTAQQ